LLSMIPPLAAAAAMVRIAAHSDRTAERHLHIAVPALVAMAGFAVTAAVLHSPLLATAALTVVAIGLAGAYGPFWGLATAALGGPTAAAGIALINSVGNLGGFVGPYVVGLVKDATGSFAGALVTLAGIAAAEALFALRLRPRR
jgi:ACS family tartrate transporter-like MFS transporter